MTWIASGVSRGCSSFANKSANRRLIPSQIFLGTSAMSPLDFSASASRFSRSVLRTLETSTRKHPTAISSGTFSAMCAARASWNATASRYRPSRPSSSPSPPSPRNAQIVAATSSSSRGAYSSYVVKYRVSASVARLSACSRRARVSATSGSFADTPAHEGQNVHGKPVITAGSVVFTPAVAAAPRSYASRIAARNASRSAA